MTDSELTTRPGPSDSEGKPVPEGYLDLGALYVPKIPGLQLRGKLEADKQTLRQVLLVLGASGISVSVAAAPKSGNSWPELAAQIEGAIEGAGGTTDEVEGPYGLEIRAQIAQQAPNGKSMLVPVRIIGVDGPRWITRIDIQGSAVNGSPEQVAACEDLIDRLIVNRGNEPRIRFDLMPLRLPKEAASLNETA